MLDTWGGGKGITGASAKRARDLHSIIAGNAEKLAAVFTRNMEDNVIDALRNATVSAIVEANTAGLTMREQAKLTQEKWQEATDSITAAVFVDRAGNEWSTGRYMQMNIRTNAMRAYNDNLANNLAAGGRDLAMISTGGDPHCKKCYPWEGRIVSISGKTAGFPTYEEALAAGLFHPNCTHSLEAVDEDLDEEEINLQRGKPNPASATDGDEAQAQAYALEVERNEAAGLSHAEAETAAKRKRLKDAARNGMPVEGADGFIDNLSKAEIDTLTDGAKVPHFALSRRGRPAGFSRGTIVFPREDITAGALRKMKGFRPKEEPEKKSTPASSIAQELFNKAQEITETHTSDGKTFTLEPLEQETIRKIEELTGEKIPVNAPIVRSDEIVHTLRRHGDPYVFKGKKYGENDKRQLPVTAEDFALIPEILKTFDTVKPGSIEKARSLTSLKFVKTYPDGTTFSVFVIADTLEYKTMWKKRKAQD